MTKGKLLAGHKQVGKKFIPETITNLSLSEINWTNDLVPELIWLAVLQQKLGYSKANLIACEFHRLYVSVCKTKFFNSMLSSYEAMDKSVQDNLLALFSASEYYENFRDGLMDFHVFFPNHPLGFLFSNIDVKMADIKVIKSALNGLSDRRSKAAMIAQASLIFNSLVAGKLIVTKDAVINEIQEIENYPNTEKSRRLGSSIRAMINASMNPQMINTESKWVKTFWQRCIEIEPCKINLEL